MINLQDYKDLKKLELINRDLLIIKDKLTDSIESLKNYAKYIPVMESISVLHNSRTIIEININKYKRILEQK
jgi:5-bromo-4-chloroindolyl phosphate hydrolysis protein